MVRRLRVRIKLVKLVGLFAVTRIIVLKDSFNSSVIINNISIKKIFISLNNVKRAL